MTKPSSKLEELLTRQGLELDALSRAEQKEALKLYRRTRGELLQRIESLDAGTFTARSYTAGLYQIEDAIRFLSRALKTRLIEGLPKLGKLGMKHLEEQTLAFLKAFPGSAKPPPFKVAWALEEGRTLLLPQFESSVNRYGMDLIQGMQRSMASGMLAGRSLFDVQKSIFQDFIKPLRTVDANQNDVPAPAYWAERIVRTERAQAYNTVVLGQLMEGAKSEPRLRKQWSAVMEKRTCETCRRMNGKVLKMNQLFTLPNGRKVAGPVAHPNCMCTLVAYMPGWEM